MNSTKEAQFSNHMETFDDKTPSFTTSISYKLNQKMAILNLKIKTDIHFAELTKSYEVNGKNNGKLSLNFTQ